MSKTVFILGAGASRDSGAPLMNDFLDRARKLYVSGEYGERFREDFERVTGAISDLQKIHSKSELDIYNIEEIFAAFEMAELINKFPGERIRKEEKKRGKKYSKGYEAQIIGNMNNPEFRKTLKRLKDFKKS